MNIQEGKITVKGIHQVVGLENDAPEVIETKSDAKFYKIEGTYYCSYEETVDGVKLKKLMKITDNKVEVNITGATSSNMVFIKGQTSKNVYNTEAGRLDLAFSTNALNIYDAINTDRLLKVKIEYDMSMNGLPASKCRMEIMIELRKH